MKNRLSPSIGLAQSSCGVVRAISMILLATCAVEVQILRPLTTQPVSVRSARVCRAAVLRPEFGSVTPKQDLNFPCMRSGIQRCFCSSVPKTEIGCGPKMFMWMAEAALIAPRVFATVCIMMAASVTPRPAPPYSSGMAMPSQPPFAMAR